MNNIKRGLLSRHQSGPTPGRLRFAGGAPAELRSENCVVALRHVRRHATPTAPARAIASMYITRPLWPIVAFPSCMLQQSFLHGPNVRPVTATSAISEKSLRNPSDLLILRRLCETPALQTPRTTYSQLETELPAPKWVGRIIHTNSQ
jgi:hypothetical protein